MQDPSIYQHQNMSPPIFPDQQDHLKCPRCESENTKFCYYNNYNLSQPRHFCKNCKRYWTKGGSLRNIPIGGAIRKTTKKTPNPKLKSPKLNPNSSPSTFTDSSPAPITPSSSSSNFINSGPKSEPGPIFREQGMQSINGGFSDLMSSSGQFGNFFNGFAQNLNLESGLGSDSGKNQDLELQSSDHRETECFSGVQTGGSSCWNADDDDDDDEEGGGGSSNGWPDLAI